MNQETRNCQSCKQDFTIEPEDFDFYQKMKVPPPTWCPDCRFQRRMTWRNFWHLFKKTEKRTGQKIFSLFPEESPVEIYEKEYWNSDAWDPMEYGRDYDWNQPFFEQFKNLMYAVPHPALSIINLVNCRFCSNCNNIKNCYFVRGSSYTEDSAYLIWDNYSKRCMDSFMTNRCEFSYGNVATERSFKTLFSVDCTDCSDVILSKDCVGCTNCFGCVGLRNKSYYFFNQQLSKEEYAVKLKEVKMNSHSSFLELQKKAYEFWLSFPRKYMHGLKNFNSTGDYVSESKNTKNSFIARGCEDSKFCQNMLTEGAKDCYDYSNWGDNVQLLYECLICGQGNSELRFCMQCYPNNRNLEYSAFCQKSSNLFGCMALKNKEYCIFNKQYTKEEYQEMLPKLRKHMDDMPYTDAKGRVYKYGEFFPPEHSTFPYPVSEAYEHFPITEKEGLDKGFLWYPLKKDEYTATLPASEIPDDINDVQDSIVNETIACEHKGDCAQECTKAFRVVKEEIDFCKQLGIPLPRLCQNCRHYERLNHRNHHNLYPRQCMCDHQVYKNASKHMNHPEGRCPNEFETSYAPERPEIIYCEQCYQAEVA